MLLHSLLVCKLGPVWMLSVYSRTVIKQMVMYKLFLYLTKDKIKSNCFHISYSHFHKLHYLKSICFCNIRYPDDPFDRIWESDSVKKANYLVDVADGTKKISTNVSIDVRGNGDEMPPVKVMQTAVVGTNGSLTYRLNLDGFPATGWAYSYLAEIEDFPRNQSRKFRLVLPGQADISKAVVNIEENALRKYRLYEPGFYNLSLPFVMSFKLGKTADSSKGPLLNAMEINKYLEKNGGSPDGKYPPHDML